MKQLLNQVFNWKHIQRLILPLADDSGNPASSLPAIATGVYQMPTLFGRRSHLVIDQADVLSRSMKVRLAAPGELGKANGEVRIVTIRRLDYGETTESFTHKLFEKWFHPDAQANQTLLVIDS